MIFSFSNFDIIFYWILNKSANISLLFWVNLEKTRQKHSYGLKYMHADYNDRLNAKQC